MKKMSESDIEKNIRITAASMGFEGLYLAEENIEVLRKIGRGETTEEIEVRRIVNKYEVK